MTTLRIMAEMDGNVSLDEARSARRKGSELCTKTCVHGESLVYV